MCEVLSRKQPYINYRPHTHHRLSLQDNLFDSRFNAYLRCEGLVNSVYYKYASHSDKTQKIAQRVTFDVTKLNKKISGTCILSDLSDSDRNNFVDGLITYLDAANPNAIVIDTNENEHMMMTSRSFISAICNSLKIKLYNIMKQDKRKNRQHSNTIKTTLDLLNSSSSSSSSSSLLTTNNSSLNFTSSMEQMNGCIESPSLFIEELINSFRHLMIANSQINYESSFNINTLIILIRFTENIDVEALGSVLCELSRTQVHLTSSDPIDTKTENQTIDNYTKISYHFIFVHSSSCRIKFHINNKFQLHIPSLPYQYTQSSNELFEIVMSRLLITHEIPILFPSSVIAWIHENYWRNDHCVRSAVNKLLSCLSFHFAQPCSILGFFEDTSWLLEMNLIKKSSIHKQAKKLQNISNNKNSNIYRDNPNDKSVSTIETTLNNTFMNSFQNNTKSLITVTSKANTSCTSVNNSCINNNSSIINNTYKIYDIEVSSNRIQCFNNIKQILPFLGNDDLAHTNLLCPEELLNNCTIINSKGDPPNKGDKNKDKSKHQIQSISKQHTDIINNYAYLILTESIRQTRYTYIWFHIILLIRDCFKPAAPTSSSSSSSTVNNNDKLTFSSDMIYATMIAPKGYKCKLISDLIRSAVIYMKHKPFLQITQFIGAVRELIKNELGEELELKIKDDTYTDNSLNSSSINISNKSSIIHNSEFENNVWENHIKSQIYARATSERNLLCAMFYDFQDINFLLIDFLEETCKKFNHTIPEQIISLNYLQKYKVKLGKVVTNANDYIIDDKEGMNDKKRTPRKTSNDSDKGTVDSLDSVIYAEHILTEFSVKLSDFIERFVKLPARLSLPGILEINDTSLDLAMDASDSNIRFKFTDVLINRSNNRTHCNNHSMKNNKSHNVLSTINGSTNPPPVPDHSILMERVNDCIGTEHVYDWFDYFISKQKPWKINTTKINHKYNRNSFSSSPSAELNIDLTSPSKGRKRSRDNETATTRNIRNDQNIKMNNSNNNNTISSNMNKDDEITYNNQNNEKIELSELVDKLTDEEFLQMKCRFANAMTDLQTSGIIKMNSSLSLAVLNDHTSKKKGKLIQDENNHENGLLNTLSNSRSLCVSRQSFSWLASI